ncbi:MAG TPA: tetratricopeptide repeat protein [Myxococcota bacterium]|jgi:Tfp pilus assembly protein PilF|nr:tetratricopeptide repeat protein [Myxococcota bacterium]
MTTPFPRCARRAAGALALGGLLALTGCASDPPASPQPDAKAQARTRYDIGVDHLKNGRSALAIRELQAADALDPNDAYIQHALGEAYRQRGLLPNAITCLQRAVELKPDFQGAVLSLSAAYIQAERYPEAIDVASKLVDDPTFGAPWQPLTNIGWAYYRLGQMDQARAAYERAIDYRPTFWRAVLNLGILEADQGNRDRALALFQEVLDEHPGPFAEAEVNYRIAEIYMAQGRNDQALVHLTAVTENKASGVWGRRSEEVLKVLR